MWNCTVEARRALPAIPLTTATGLTQQQRQRQQLQQRDGSPLQRWSEAPPFEDDGHYTDIQWNGSGSGAARIPTWRQSSIDDPGHYNYPDFSAQAAGEQNSVEQRTSSGYEGLNRAELAQTQRIPHDYTSVAGPYLVPVEKAEDDNRRVPERFRQPDQNGVRCKSDSAVYMLQQNRNEMPQRAHSHVGVNISFVTGRHSYLELIGAYSGLNNIDSGTSGKGYEGLDPAEVEELRRRENKPHEYSGLQSAGVSNREQHCEAVITSERCKGLDPFEVGEARERTRRAPEYTNVEDLYSRPIKKKR